MPPKLGKGLGTESGLVTHLSWELGGKKRQLGRFFEPHARGFGLVGIVLCGV